MPDGWMSEIQVHFGRLQVNVIHRIRCAIEDLIIGCAMLSGAAATIAIGIVATLRFAAIAAA